MNIQLPTGKTMSISVYEFLFELKDSEVDFFYQAAIADDLGSFIENPWSGKKPSNRVELEIDQEPNIDITNDINISCEQEDVDD